MGFSAPAAAQTDAPSSPSLPKAFSSSAEDDEPALAPPTVSPVDFELAWSNWRTSLSNEGPPAFDRLDDIRRARAALGRPNLPRYSNALLVRARRRSSRPASEAKPNRTRRMLTVARQFAPDLPYPSLQRAATLVWSRPTQLQPIVGSYSRGVVRAFSWPYTRLAYELQLIWALLAALAVVGPLFVAVQIVRGLGVAAEDAARLLPSFVARGHCLAVFLLVAITAGLYTSSPLAALGAAFVLALPAQHSTERIATLVLLAGLASLPAAQQRITDLSTFPGGESSDLLEAQYVGCNDECRQSLRASLRNGEGRADTAFTLALAELRSGSAPAAARAADLLDAERPGRGRILGRIQNLRGAAAAIRGNYERAVERLRTAEDRLPRSAAPPFNLARVYQLQGRSGDADAALQRAIDRSVGAIHRRLELQSNAPAVRLMLEPLPLTYFHRSHARRTEGRRTAVAAVWTALAGPRVPLRQSPWLAAIGALLVLVTWPLHWFGFTSTPCPNCGLARRPSDADQTGGDYRCLPCYRTIVGGPGAGYRAEVREDARLERRASIRRALRRGLSALLPGAGHVFAGHALRGLMISMVLAGAVWFLVGPQPVWRAPYDLASTAGIGLVPLAWTAASISLIAGAVGAYRDLEPYDPGER
ncbi:MAG: hypothetical protein ABEL76_00780 [Bradymonadaceae bacterium]